MYHYEIVIIIHPDRIHQVSDIIDYYSNIVNKNQGKINHLENWGRRPLAYPIKKLHKAYYILFNIQISPIAIHILESSFRFNEAIIRSMIIRVKHAIHDLSPIMKLQENHHEDGEKHIVQTENLKKIS